MAQPINCDGPGDPHPAAVLVQYLDGSSYPAFCSEHWPDYLVFMATAIIEEQAAADLAAATAAADAEAAEADAEALRRLSGATVAPGGDGSASGHVDPPAGVVGSAGTEAAASADVTDELVAGPDDDEDDDEDELAGANAATLAELVTSDSA